MRRTDGRPDRRSAHRGGTVGVGDGGVRVRSGRRRQEEGPEHRPDPLQPRGLRRGDPRRRAAEVVLPRGVLDPDVVDAADTDGQRRGRRLRPLLVDKLAPVIREPQRWDVTVFSYPLQKNHNYVKRLVGLPGETLFIGGGNLYRVTTANGTRHYEVLRKPDRIQQEQWREVYPARLYLHEDQKVLGGMLRALPANAWS